MRVTYTGGFLLSAQGDKILAKYLGYTGRAIINQTSFARTANPLKSGRSFAANSSRFRHPFNKKHRTIIDVNGGPAVRVDMLEKRTGYR